MNALEEILVGVRIDLARRQERVSSDDLSAAVERQTAALPAEAVLRDGASVRVIAEVKRSSPSKGTLASIGDPAGLAEKYAAGGASWVSVLTEERRFGGSLGDLKQVRDRVDVPVLRKDFVVSGYQVLEARAAGADAVLLLAVALGQAALVSLIERTHSLGMCALVEVHDADEVPRAVDAGARVIGVNARDLRTLEIDRDTYPRLAPLIPAGCVVVAASGIRGPHDVLRYAREGADAVLVGEALVTHGRPEEAVRQLVSAGAHPTGVG